MDLLSYFRILRRRWLVILLCVVVGAAIGIASTQLSQGTTKSKTFYKATDTLVLSEAEGASNAPSITNIDQMAILATTGDVPAAVVKELELTEPAQKTAERVVTLTSGVTNTLRLTAAASTADEATKLADSFSTQLIASLDAKELARYNAQRDQLSKQLSDFKTQADAFLAQLQQVPRPPDVDTIQKQYDATQNQYYATYGQLQELLSAGAPQTGLSLLTRAQAVPINQAEYDSRLSLGALGQNNLRDDGSSNTNGASITTSSDSAVDSPLARGLLGAFLGLLVGIGIAMLRERLDHRIRNRIDAEDAYQLPVLAEVPEFPSNLGVDEVISNTQPMSAIAETYRAVRTSVLFQLTGTDGFTPEGTGDPAREHRPLVIMVTSAVPGEGKSATTANLAVVFAESGAKVLVVNCDFRRPTVHRCFGLEDQARRVQATSVPGLKVVTNVLDDPETNPAQYIAAQRQVVAAAREHFDVVLLDTAPVLAANDPLALVPSADVVLVVARSELTKVDDAHQTGEALVRLEAPLGGVVLVSSQATPARTYYYSHVRPKTAPPPETAIDDVVFGNGAGRATTTAPGSSAPELN